MLVIKEMGLNEKRDVLGEWSNGCNEYRNGLDQLMTLLLEWKNGLDEKRNGLKEYRNELND
jgi:hypothetical protein